MSISCRGLIAAGLALGAIGVIGVSSTLNAGAATIAETPTPNTTAAETMTLDLTTASQPMPPPPPPGKRTWRSSGDTGATAFSRSTLPKPRFAAKGMPIARRSSATTATSRTTADGAALTADGAALTADSAGVSALADQTPPAAAAAAVSYLYSSASQFGDNDGTYAYLTVARPRLATNDAHSLAEVVAQSADQRQIAEVGWTVDRVTNDGSIEPHLFVFYWVDGVRSKCYNCKFMPYPPLDPTKPPPPDAILPGMSLAADVGTVKRFSIQHANGAWWMGYDNKWFGYFPDSLWTGRFTRAGLSQWFGEVAAAAPAPCTDMGNGLPAADTAATSFTRIGYYNGPAPDIATGASSTYYTIKPLTPNSFRYGGPGAC